MYGDLGRAKGILTSHEGFRGGQIGTNAQI